MQNDKWNNIHVLNIMWKTVIPPGAAMAEWSRAATSRDSEAVFRNIVADVQFAGFRGQICWWRFAQCFSV